jgi:hypothetical protein
MRRLLSRLGSHRAIRSAVAALLLTSYPVLLAAAALASLPGGRAVFAIAAAACYLAELAAPDMAPALAGQLSWLQVGAGVRAVIRQCALMILLARATDVDAYQLAVLALGVFGLHAVRAACSAAVIYIVKRRRLPVVTRNVDLGALGIPDAPPRLLTTNHSWRLLLLDIPAMAGGVVTAFTGDYGWILAGFGAGIGAGLAAGAILAVHLWRHRRLAGPLQVLRAVNARIQEHAPELVLYFSGGRQTIYQADMWLPVLARLDRPALIVMRERWLVGELGRTSLPVVCIDDQGDLADFELPTVKVVLYPANNAKNIHMLRLRGMAHVFVGHGDSDKAASSNPFSKAYDEVWVAGQAGKDRYLRANVGIRPENLRAVGRPQLADLVPPGRPAGPDQITVLYAPTWEGWESAGSPMSTTQMGSRLVSMLTADDRIRLVYRPHPLTGTRSPAAAAAHQQVIAIIAKASQARAARMQGSEPADEAALLVRLGRMEAKRAALGHTVASVADPVRAGWPDYAGMARDGVAGAAGEAAWLRLTEDWHGLYWSGQPAWQHLVQGAGPLPTLYSTFNQCDLMISDISSLVSDFTATGKPYVVTNPNDVPGGAFRASNPSVAAAYVLNSDCAGLTDIVAQLVQSGADRLVGERSQLRAYLLGPDEPPSQARFNAAVAHLVGRWSTTVVVPAPHEIDTGQDARGPLETLPML